MSEKVYTDQELLWATQIAYCNISDSDILEYMLENNGETPTLQSIFSKYGYSIYYDPEILIETEGDKGKMSASAKQFIDDVIAGKICQGWKVVSVRDDQSDTGLFALTIETGADEAIVAFRGSELVDRDQFIKDWCWADFTMISGEPTAQEIVASQYIEEVGNSFDYGNLVLTGHSLGGNLALVATVHAAEMEDETLFSRIKQSVSFDGQGHPEEYIAAHRKGIEKCQDIMTHYQWSLVGALLTSLCEGDNYKHILSDQFASLVLKHSTASLRIDGDGNLILQNGSMDDYARGAHLFTSVLDELNCTQMYASDILYMLFDFMENFNDMISIAKENMIPEDEIEKFLTSGALYMISCYLIVFTDVEKIVNGDWKHACELALASWEQFLKSGGTLAENLVDNYGPNSEMFSKCLELLGEGMRDCIGLDILNTERIRNIAMEISVKNICGIMGTIVRGAVKTFTDVYGVFNAIMEAVYEMYTKAFSAFVEKADPLVFDMDGDGFEILGKEDGAYFDEDNTDLKEKTEWVASDDALLAVDWNGDGVIGDGSELFGTSTLMKDGSMAGSGFEALAQYDDNGDGVIDVRDEIYSRLLMWQDADGDGISQENELYTLEELGIESISLRHEHEDGINVARVSYKDGTTGKIGEFYFEANLYDTIEIEETEISEEIRELPNVRSIGTVASLHTLMQQDETGVLREYVTEFIQCATAEDRRNSVQKILYHITGAEQIDPESRGDFFDAQKLKVIERLMGQDFMGTRGRNPVNTAATILQGVYEKLVNLYYTLLVEDSLLKEYLGMTFWTVDEQGKRYLDTSLFEMYMKLDTNGKYADIVGEMGGYIWAFNPDNKDNFTDYAVRFADNRKYVEAIADRLGSGVNPGTDAADELVDVTGYLFGFGGNDTMRSGYGDDVLIGGAGDDYLSGGAGADTYIYNRGDGNDTIYNHDSGAGRMNDRLVFGEGIQEDEIAVRGSGLDLVLTDTVTGQTVTIQSAYSNQNNYLENIEFADGTVWDMECIKEKLAVINGTEEADTLYGYDSVYGCTGDETVYAGGGDDTVYAYNGADTVYGGEGNDRLYGGNGNDLLMGEEGGDSLYGEGGDDTLIGGAGDDYLAGGNGADTYIYNRGDGNDTICNYDGSAGRMNDRLVFGEGIQEDEIAVRRSGNDLVLTDTVTGQTVTIQNAYTNQNNYLENIEFADGTVWDMEYIKEKLTVVNGTEEADTLYGYNSAYGCIGDETVYAGGGDDTVYVYNGADTVYGGEGNDRLYGGNGNDLLMGEEGGDSLYGEGGDDVLIGGAGDDYLSGGAGADTYIYNRGDGNDTIYNHDSGAGRMNDRLVFGEGIQEDEIAVRGSGLDLVLTDTVTGQTVTIQNAYTNRNNYLENIEFADGTVWDMEYIKEKLAVINGTEEADTLYGYDSVYGCTGDETVYAGGGDDTVRAAGGADIIYGGDGNDSLYGENGDDVLIGGVGDDYLSGGNGADTYIYSRGDGNDTIYNFDTGVGADTLTLGVRVSDLAFSRKGDNLFISIGDGEGSITVQNWYVRSNYQLDSIRTEDGYSLAGEQVDLLIQAMASFESASGLSWQDAIRMQDEQAVSIADQYWLKQAG